MVPSVQKTTSLWLGLALSMLAAASGLAGQEEGPEPRPEEEPAQEEVATETPPAEEAPAPAESSIEDPHQEVEAPLRFYPPEGAQLALVVGDTRKMGDAWEGMALGKLAANEEMKAFIAEVESSFDERTQEVAELDERIEELEIETESTLIEELTASFGEMIDEEAFGIAGAHVALYLGGESFSDSFEDAALVGAIALRGIDPQGLAELLAEACRKALGEDYARDEDLAGPEGFEVIGYQAKDAAEDLGHLWYFLDGSTVYVGVNAEDRLGGLRSEPDSKIQELISRASGGLTVGSFFLDLEGFLGLLTEEGDDDIEEVKRVLDLLGLDDLGAMVYSVEIAGESLREVSYVESDGEPRGAWKILGKLPAERTGALQALTLPAPRVFELEGRFDLDHLAEWLPDVLDRIDPDDEDVSAAQLEKTLQGTLGMSWQELLETFTGDYAFSIASPPLGMTIPQFALALSIGDRERFDELLALAKEKGEGLIFEQVEFKETTFTTVKVPNSPVPLVPTFGLLDDQLVITEVPNTFKAILRERGRDSAAADLPVPIDQGTGASIRMAYDVGETYRLFYDVYFPLIRLGLGQLMADDQAALVDLDLLPGSHVIAPYLGKGWSVARFEGEGMISVSESSLGSPTTSLMASFYGVLGVMFAGMGMEEARAVKERQICRHEIGQIYGALEAYRASFGGGESLPDSLGQLVERGLIQDLAVFVVPSDEDPGTIEYETLDGEIETFECSYKYLPQSKLQVDENRLYDFEGGGLFGGMIDSDLQREFRLQAEVEGEEPPQRQKTIILYESNSNRHGGRFVLCADGSIYHLTESDFAELVSVR